MYFLSFSIKIHVCIRVYFTVCFYFLFQSLLTVALFTYSLRTIRTLFFENVAEHIYELSFFLCCMSCISGQPHMNLTFSLMDIHPGNELFIYIRMKYSNVFLLLFFEGWSTCTGGQRGMRVFFAIGPWRVLGVYPTLTAVVVSSLRMESVQPACC